MASKTPLAERIRYLAVYNLGFAEIAAMLGFEARVLDRLMSQEPDLAVQLIEGQALAQGFWRADANDVGN